MVCWSKTESQWWNKNVKVYKGDTPAFMWMQKLIQKEMCANLTDNNLQVFFKYVGET